MRRTVVIATLMSGILVLTPHSGNACSCGPPPPPLTALGQADAVFTGIVLSIVPAVDSHMLAVSFYVTGAWKGIGSRTTTVYTSASSAACGFAFQKFAVYIVYASRYVLACCGLQMETHMCTRTAIASRAQEDFEALGEPTSVPFEESTWGRVKALYE